MVIEDLVGGVWVSLGKSTIRCENRYKLVVQMGVILKVWYSQLGANAL